ncbi:hypothetical protein [Thalassotalea litorea]|uniref:hypothetical protein n=1 Tax=Thalassotalea litorea TaxID=2020715 RepID=UPI003734CB11
MAAKRYPLPKKLSVGLSEKAYENLRVLNSQYHYSNNYLLTILLENLDTLVDATALEQVMAEFKAEYGAPAPAKMGKGS